MCNVCYREMRSDVLKRHMKQHSKGNESVPATNITNNIYNNIYNNNPSVSTSDPRKGLNEKSKITKEQLRKEIMKDANEYQEKLEHEYQEKLELGKMIYKMMGEVEVPYQSLKRNKK